LPHWRPRRLAFNQGWSIIATFAGILDCRQFAPDNAVENQTPLLEKGLDISGFSNRCLD
jgi:hypothetical protein